MDVEVPVSRVADTGGLQHQTDRQVEIKYPLSQHDSLFETITLLELTILFLVSYNIYVVIGIDLVTTEQNLETKNPGIIHPCFD